MSKPPLGSLEVRSSAGLSVQAGSFEVDKIDNFRLDTMFRQELETHPFGEWQSINDGRHAGMIFAPGVSLHGEGDLIGTDGDGNVWSYRGILVAISDEAGITIKHDVITTIYEDDPQWSVRYHVPPGEHTMFLQVKRLGGTDRPIRWVATIRAVGVIRG